MRLLQFGDDLFGWTNKTARVCIIVVVVATPGCFKYIQLYKQQQLLPPHHIDCYKQT